MHGFYRSKEEDNPWLRIQLNRATSFSSVTLTNRKDCCGARLQNLEIRAGMKNDLTNELVATFKGPGITGGIHEIEFKKSVIAEFLTLQLNKKSAILQVNGILLSRSKHLPTFTFYVSFSMTGSFVCSFSIETIQYCICKYKFKPRATQLCNCFSHTMNERNFDIALKICQYSCNSYCRHIGVALCNFSHKI